MTCNIKKILSNVALYIAIAISGVVLIYSMSNVSYVDKYNKLSSATNTKVTLTMTKTKL